MRATFPEVKYYMDNFLWAHRPMDGISNGHLLRGTPHCHRLIAYVAALGGKGNESTSPLGFSINPQLLIGLDIILPFVVGKPCL